MAMDSRSNQPGILFLSALTTDSGSGVRFWNMARAVADAGWPVTFLERRPSGLPGRGAPRHRIPEHPGGRSIRVIRTDPDWFRPVRSGGSGTGGLLRSILALAAGEGRRLAEERPWRAVYALKPLPNAVLPALRAGRRGARIVLDVDDLDFEYYPPGLQRALVRRWFRLWPRRFDAVSYHVEPLREYLQTESGVPAERLRRIPQCVDLDVFAAPPAPLPAEIAEFTRRHATIVYMASLGITSDFDDVLPALARILARHPDWGLLVLGHGVRLERFRGQAAALGVADRIRFAGYVAHAAVPAVLRACRAGFHYLRPAGANRYRAIMKIREYLAAGLPVVANPSADAADFRDFIELAEGEEAVERALAAALAGERAERTAAGRRSSRSGWPGRAWRRISWMFWD